MIYSSASFLFLFLPLFGSTNDSSETRGNNGSSRKEMSMLALTFSSTQSTWCTSLVFENESWFYLTKFINLFSPTFPKEENQIFLYLSLYPLPLTPQKVMEANIVSGKLYICLFIYPQEQHWWAWRESYLEWTLN